MPQGRITITDVAQLAGTSAATVSNYLNGHFEKMSPATRETIRRAIERTGYVPGIRARSLAGSSSGIIAVLILNSANIWAGQVFIGIEEVAAPVGYQTVVCNSNFDQAREQAYVEKMLSLGVDGFIVQPTSNFRAIHERITRAGKPVVLYDCSTFSFDTSWIKTNLYDSTYGAMLTCADRGYEHFVLVGSEPDLRTRQEREQGFIDAVASRGLTYETLRIDHDGPGTDELAAWFRLNLITSRRTLVFVPHQWALERVYRALMEQPQLIPDGVGLLGMNNADWACLTTPRISTIVEPVREEGALACRMLLDLLADPAARPRQEILSCQVSWLDTTMA